MKAIVKGTILGSRIEAARLSLKAVELRSSVLRVRPSARRRILGDAYVVRLRRRSQGHWI